MESCTQPNLWPSSQYFARPTSYQGKKYCAENAVIKAEEQKTIQILDGDCLRPNMKAMIERYSLFYYPLVKLLKSRIFWSSFRWVEIRKKPRESFSGDKE